ncbi:MAG: anion transporter [Ignavibacteriae bacterium HGW-Ignavibacteriae-2]|jgi:Na+/H+ antiporter NhaD/arsenite permease-like protein|nr:MAG: anion transporter [Ignavibacteriae bacterium HGW-Ignavibacteriae-2]
MQILDLISLSVIIITIIGVAIGRYPLLRMNRSTIAMVGAVILIVINSITLDEAYNAIDLNTIVLLFSIMVLNANYRLSGFFNLVTNEIIKIAKTPKRLLGVIIFLSGVLSALFLNDTIVLVFTPIVIELTTTLRRNPLPYLIALVTSANIGSAATIIGNPQNILIGASSQIPFFYFTLKLMPVSILGLLTIWLVLILIYKEEFKSKFFTKIPFHKTKIFKPLLIKSVLSTAIMLIALFAGAPTSLAIMCAAALLLVTRRLKPERVFKEIDWSLLVFFSGLFIVTKSIETMGYSSTLLKISRINSGNFILDLSLISAVISNLVSNVPAVLLLRPFVETFGNPDSGWLTLAMATTFAGNLTLLGSVANLIVAESARKQGIVISFTEYLKAGIPITIISLIIGVFWLNLFL